MARDSRHATDGRTAAQDDKRARRKRTGAGTARRALGMVAFLPLAARAPLYARLFFALVVDERTPASRKALLAGALGYLLLGRDIVPDDVPLLGGLDDLVVVALAVDLFLDGVDEDLLDEKLEELGIARSSFDEDISRIRKLMPGPIRRSIRRLPGLARFAGETIERSGIAPRLRGWITREGFIA
jgi:uncharacterized membrane protein YkvA (DUF1232 family)